MDEYDLIKVLARDEKVNHSRRKIKKSVAVIFDEIAAALARGQRVEIEGIGVFSTRTIGARWDCDPVTGRSVMRPETRHSTFRTDKKLTAHLNASTSTVAASVAKRAGPLPRQGRFIGLGEASPLLRLFRWLRSGPTHPGPSPH